MRSFCSSGTATAPVSQRQRHIESSITERGSAFARVPPPPWDFWGLLGGPGLAVGEDADQLAEHHGEGVGARAGGVVEEAVPHALDGALLRLDELGRDGAQPLDEAADLATLRVGVGAGLRLGSQGHWLLSD